ncbi:MAG: hypothetical protein E6176_07630 [Clostridium celatum]|nr:hypothetical protein [Clostridium celatum]
MEDIKSKEKELKENLKLYETENYTIPVSKFKSLTTSLKYYEILNSIELVIHVRSDEKTLNEIEENIYNLKSIGRSEDFVHVEEAKIVELKEDDECEIISNYSAYLNYDDVKNKKVWFDKLQAGRVVTGTKYYLNKSYEIKDGKRFFEKKKVLYASQYFIEETSENIFIDNESNKEYLINSYNNSLYVADKYNWKVIKCTKDGKLRSIEDINNEIYDNIKNYINI